MFVAHFPAGYIVSRLFKDRLCKAAVMVGSVIPDIDLAYFYTFGHRAVVHHEYWTHMPLFWLTISLLALIVVSFVKWSSHKVVLAFAVGTMVHLFLDSFIGTIYWFYPFSDLYVTFFTVPARHETWQLNFLLHWTFMCELSICVAAAYLFIRQRYRQWRLA